MLSRQLLQPIVGLALLVTFLGPAESALALPKLPDSVKPPESVNLACMKDSKTLPDIHTCLFELEKSRETLEEYNTRLTRFCLSLQKFDLELRKKFKEKTLTLSEYEELQARIVSETAECEPGNGDYFKDYRQRMREYRYAAKALMQRREDLLRAIRIGK